MAHQPPYGGYAPQPPRFQPPQPPRDNRRRTSKIILSIVGGVIGLFVFLAVVGAVIDGTGSQKPAAAPLGTSSPDATRKASAKSKAKPKADVVTFVVNGRAPSGVDVTYGTDTDNRQGPKRLPVRRTLKFTKKALYYVVSAQLNGSGDITCKVLHNGKPVASGHASGGYSICSAQWNGGLLGF
jgi:hypothetical protein